jgi:hypothetical protein
VVVEERDAERLARRVAETADDGEGVTDLSTGSHSSAGHPDYSHCVSVFTTMLTLHWMSIKQSTRLEKQ